MCENICVIYLGEMCISGIVGSYGKCIFNLVKIVKFFFMVVFYFKFPKVM